MHLKLNLNEELSQSNGDRHRRQIALTRSESLQVYRMHKELAGDR